MFSRIRLFLSLGLLVTSGVARGQINIAFHNGATTVNAMTGRPAGATVNTSVDTWNNVANNTGVGLAFSNFVLRDRANVDTGARLASTAGSSFYNTNNWNNNTQDHVMMEGWYGLHGSESITVTNLPPGYAAGFSVVVYGDSNDSSRTMNYSIAGQTKTIQDSGLFNGTFTDGSNFRSFVGLTGSSFTLTGNPGAGDARSSVSGLVIIPTVLPQLPVIDTFTADDHYVSPGSPVTLSWQSTDADSVVISPGIGTVTAASGSVVVNVSQTTTFTLTATNGDGDTTATLRVGAGPPRPNILFFLVDDMGWQDTSEPFYYVNGSPVITPLNQRYRTPGMETLASRGMKFTNAYAMPVCSPSRTCWITGLNSARHHVTNWTSINGVDTDENSTTSHNSPTNWEKAGLPANLTTLPSLLQAAGYRTIHAGKAHFGSTPYAKQPLNLGFDVNIAGSEIGHPGSYSGTYGAGGTQAVQGLDAYHNTNTHLSEALTLEMNKAIETAVDDGTPFFAYMAHYAVHSPFQTDPRFSANYPTLSGGELAYATLIEGMDKSLGDILAKLQQLGVADDTLVIFMSDNGGDSPFSNVNNSNAPLRHKKGSKYEGGVREPMIVSWAQPSPTNPFQTALPIQSGSRQDDIVAIFDFFPTFAAVAGIPAPTGIDGYDLTPYFRADPGFHRPQELLIHYPHDHRSDYFTILRQGDWKLIYNYASNTYELYNLANDISESNDLAASEPQRVMTMSRAMARELSREGAQWPTFAAGGADDPFAAPNLPAVDADSDGIPDNTEDANSNGLVDPGETNPDSDNSDSDPDKDGVEIRTGTNPLDASSFFRASFQEVGGNLILSWPSAPGALYRIESSTAADSIAWGELTDNLPASAGTSTTFDLGPANSTPRAFYRVGLK